MIPKLFFLGLGLGGAPGSGAGSPGSGDGSPGAGGSPESGRGRPNMREHRPKPGAGARIDAPPPEAELGPPK